MHHRPLLLVLAVLALVGCRTTRANPDSLAFLRGRPALVVSELQEPHEARAQEAALERQLALVPVRVWPSSADRSLEEALAGGAADRLVTARREAEERRIPWLIVPSEGSVRVETTRTGEQRWESGGRPATGPHRQAEALRLALGASAAPDSDTLLDPASVRLCPPDRLQALRLSAAGGRWEDHRVAMTTLVTTYPADPALAVHAALEGLLRGEPAADAGLRQSRALSPEGESELLAIALVSDGAANGALSLGVRDALVRLWPDRLDYRPELADLRATFGSLADAIAVCRSGLGGVADPEALRATPRGSAPDQAPDALPYADLRFTLAWYLAQAGDPAAGLASYEHALDVYEALDRPRELADTLNNTGVALVQAGRPAVAVPLLRKAVSLREEQGRAAKAATTQHNLARALAESRRFDDAIVAFERASAAHDAAGDAFAAVESLYEAIEHEAARGDRGRMERRGADVLARLDALDGGGTDPARDELRGSVWFELGQGRDGFGDHEGALVAYAEARALYRGCGARLFEAQALYSMAIPAIALFRLEEAYVHLIAALGIAVELGDSASIIDIRDQVSELRRLIRATGRTPVPVPEPLLPYLDLETE